MGLTADDTDFGRVVSVPPAAVVECVKVDDIAAALASARQRDLKVVVRGAGHSCGGQSVGGGLVLRDFSDDEAHLTLTGDLVEVPARVSWSHLERWLNARGRSNPVTPDYLDLSVGGTDSPEPG